MHITTQYSVEQSQNPGTLANLIDTIALAKVNLIAITVVDAPDQGVIRLVADDPDALRLVLDQLRIPYQHTQVLLVDLTHKPGSLAQVLALLAAENLDPQYAYVTSGGAESQTLGILKVSNPGRAMKLLEAHEKSKQHR